MANRMETMSNLAKLQSAGSILADEFRGKSEHAKRMAEAFADPSQVCIGAIIGLAHPSE
jgi:hypothetical protein